MIAIFISTHIAVLVEQWIGLSITTFVRTWLNGNRYRAPTFEVASLYYCSLFSHSAMLMEIETILSSVLHRPNICLCALTREHKGYDYLDISKADYRRLSLIHI